MVKIIDLARTIDHSVRVHYQDFASGLWIIGKDDKRKLNYGGQVRETTAIITDVFEGTRTTNDVGATKGQGEYKGIHLVLKCDCCRTRSLITYESHADIATLLEDLKTSGGDNFIKKPEQLVGVTVKAYYIDGVTPHFTSTGSCGLCLGISKPE